MEGNVTDRRFSVAVTPLWLDSASSSAPVTTPGSETIPVTRDSSPRPEHADVTFPKVQIQVSDLPRIQLITNRRHGGTDTNFENTEVEELIAMLRETENLEEQGDILQYLVDTQGLDFNTGNFHGHFEFIS